VKELSGESPDTDALATQRAFWDAEAASFDDEPDHGLRDERTRAAWWELLAPLVPEPPAQMVDLGCGTGSLSVLLAEAGHQVRGLDLAPAMIEQARRKAERAEVTVDFRVGDAGSPPYGTSSADLVLVRHVLWAMRDPDAALAEWCRVLRADGRLVLVEGRWHTGGGLRADETRELVRRHREVVEVRALDDPVLWGGPVSDERYLLVA
jgi:SAM-dependent methyltransferase